MTVMSHHSIQGMKIDTSLSFVKSATVGKAIEGMRTAIESPTNLFRYRCSIDGMYIIIKNETISYERTSQRLYTKTKLNRVHTLR